LWHCPARPLPGKQNIPPVQRTPSWLRGVSTLIKKIKKIFLIYKEIQSGAVAKSYMRKGFIIYEEMRKYFHIYEEAVNHI
jgi:hypothetical protein